MVPLLNREIVIVIEEANQPFLFKDLSSNHMFNVHDLVNTPFDNAEPIAKEMLLIKLLRSSEVWRHSYKIPPKPPFAKERNSPSLEKRGEGRFFKACHLTYVLLSNTEG